MNTRVTTCAPAALTLALATVGLAGGPVTMTPPPGAVVALPDLVVSDITFKVAERTTWGNDHPCTIYDLTAKVKNDGKGDAGPFNVLIERNRGAAGAFEKGCEGCLLAVSGLKGGGIAILQSLRFNNCGNSWNTFRVTADPEGRMMEGHEDNNSRTETYVPRLDAPLAAASHLPAHPTPVAAPKKPLILYGQLTDGRWVAVTRGTLYWTGEAGLLALCADGSYRTMAGDVLNVKAHGFVHPGEVRGFNPQPEPPARELVGRLADGREVVLTGKGAFLAGRGAGKGLPGLPDGRYHLSGGGVFEILRGHPTSNLLPEGLMPAP